MLNVTTLTITQVTTYIKSILEGDKNLERVMLIGEISNLRVNSSGHVYFTLKDKNCAIKAVMFKKYASYLSFAPSDGMLVTVGGSISVYDKDGSYEVMCTDMLKSGSGEISQSLDDIKRQLANEGLFDTEHKKNIPAFPKKIAVLTARGGAAFQDIISVVGRRYPLAELLLYPVPVQGAEAEGKLIAALKDINRACEADVAIIARGGGSAEDLDVFNSVLLAHAIYDSSVPIISAVGHEIDYTICDMVADRRAATPSAAAELAVPDFREIVAALGSYETRITRSLDMCTASYKSRLGYLTGRLMSVSPSARLLHNKNKLKSCTDRISKAIDYTLYRNNDRLIRLSGKLDALSPLKTLSRGYAVVYKHDHAVNSITQISLGDNITVRMHDGSITATAVSGSEDKI